MAINYRVSVLQNDGYRKYFNFSNVNAANACIELLQMGGYAPCFETIKETEPDEAITWMLKQLKELRSH